MFEDSLLESGGKKLKAAPARTMGDCILVRAFRSPWSAFSC